MKKAFYAGSFDPITKGHKNVIEQASKVFDEVVVAVMQNSKKTNSFFTLEERLELAQEICRDIDNVEVMKGEGTAVRLAKLYDCQALIRGLRGVTDLMMKFVKQQQTEKLLIEK